MNKNKNKNRGRPIETSVSIADDSVDVQTRHMRTED